jgi:hypothetical protein
MEIMTNKKLTKKDIETLYAAGELPELESLFKENKLSPQFIGLVRRLLLTDLLAKIEALPPEKIQPWLKGERLDRVKLAEAVGFGCIRDSINQSFKKLVADADERLNLAPSLSNFHIGLDNVSRFVIFLTDRLSNGSYNWPITDRNKLYHKRLYMNFLDEKDKISLVTSAPSWFYSNDIIIQRLADIDALIAEGKLKTLSYASECALDEMSDSMTSQKVKNLSAQLNEKKIELANEREAHGKSDKLLRERESELEAVKVELSQYKQREKAIYNQSKGSIKIAGAH